MMNYGRILSKSVVSEKDAKKDLEKANYDLKELVKIKSEFSLITSHQLRTPVSIVRSYLSMVVEGKVALAKALPFVQKAYEGINRMETIINDILTTTELMGHHVKIKLESTNLERLIKNTIDSAEPFLHGKKIELKFEGPKEFPYVLIDQDKLKNAIFNLLINAIYYTDKGGIKVVLEQVGHFAKIVVKDSGIGFTPEEKEELGNKFFRSKQAILTHPNGSGLGIYIAKTYIEAMQGRLEFDSKGRGQGSEFVLSIPIN